MKKIRFLIIVLVTGLIVFSLSSCFQRNHSFKETIAGPILGTMVNYTNLSQINDLLISEGFIWAATSGGVARVNLVDNTYVQYTTAQGLVDNFVNSISIGINGDLWIGTNNGVSRFDGTKWHIFDIQNRLSNTVVRDTIADNDDNIWFATWGKGVFKYDGVKITNYTTKNGLCHNNIYSIYLDNEGSLWFGTVDGVSKFDKTGWHIITHNDTQHIFDCTSIIKDKNQNIWLGTAYNGIYELIGDEFSIYTMSSDSYGDPFNWITAINSDSGGNLWFGAIGGVSKFDGNSMVTYQISNDIVRDHVNSISSDETGNIWFATGTGIVKYDGRNWSKYVFERNPVDDYVSAMVHDPDGGMWFSTFNKGVFHFDSLNWQTYTTADGLADNKIEDMIIDNKVNVWFAHIGKISKFDGHNWITYQTGFPTIGGGELPKQPLSLVVDYRGNLWLNINNGASKFDGQEWTIYTTKDGLADEWVNDITVDDEGKVWFATNDGLSSYDGSKWTTYGTNSGLPHNIVRTVVFHNKALWLGTIYPVSRLFFTEYEGGGLTKFDLKSNSFTTYTTKDGMANNEVGTIGFDSDDAVWVASLYSDSGVSRLLNNQWYSYTTNQGLISNVINNIAVDSKGNIWFSAFSATHGLTELIPGLFSIQDIGIPHSINILDSVVLNSVVRTDITRTNAPAIVR